MGSEARIVYLIIVLLAYDLRDISAVTRCYECGTIFTPYCEDPLFLKGTLTYKPTLCRDLVQNDIFASKVITMFMTYMTDSTEEMEGTNSVSGPAEQRRRRSIVVSWLDRVAAAFRISNRSKRQILNSLPGNWTYRQDDPDDDEEEKVEEKPAPAKDDDEEDDKSSIEGDVDDFKCYKLVFANQRDELEEFRGCVLTKLFDVCDLLINFNEKSKERVVFCELCHEPMVDKEHPPCNHASTFNSSRVQTFILALSWIHYSRHLFVKY